jgi:fatty acid desaturase
MTTAKVHLSSPDTSTSYPSHPLWNGLAISYTLVAYVAGLALTLQASAWLNLVGILLLTHALVYSAYLSHDFMHGSIFTRRWLLGRQQWNALFGNLMLWLNGGCYARFEDLAKLHIAHHVKRVDYRVDLKHWLKSQPMLRNLIVGLEWLGFPLVDYILRWRSMSAPFWLASRREERLRVLLILAIRGAAFAYLGWISLKALFLYGIAHVGMVHILRFVDVFHHTYHVLPLGAKAPQLDYEYEQANTFSNVLSLHYPWLNLIFLNFSYHNAHHHAMHCPWHSLPQLDRTLFQGNQSHYIPLYRVFWNYHHYYFHRMFSLDPGQVVVDEQGQYTLSNFYGALGVSFLVLPS